MFVDDGVEHDPGQTVVLQGGQLGRLMEDEHCDHLSGYKPSGKEKIKSLHRHLIKNSSILRCHFCT